MIQIQFIRRLALLMVIIITYGSSYALRFQQITVDDGLASGLVYRIAQDSLGFMWFATGNGLSRFSGNSFSRFGIPEMTSESSSLEWVNIVANINNRVYAGTRTGMLLAYDYRANDLQVLSSIPGREVLSITQYSDNEILVGYNHGVKMVNVSENTSYWIHENISLVRDFVILPDSTLLVATRYGLVSLSLKRSELGRQLEEWITDSEVLAIYQDKHENYWVGTESDGLFVLDKNGQRLYHHVYINAANIPAAIRVITSRDGNSIFLGADDIGIREVSFEFENISTIRRDPDNPYSLSLNSIRDIYFDKNNRMWIATTGGGVNLYDPNLKPFHIIRRELNNPNSLVDNMIRCILEDSDNQMWIGTENGLSKWVVGENHWTTFNAQRGLNNNAVLCLAEYENFIVAGTYGGGLNFISRDGRETFFRNTQNGGLKGTNFIFSVMVDSWGRIWYGGHNGYMGVISPDGHETTVEIDRVRTIRELSDGTILVGSLSGIYEVNRRTFEIELLHYYKSEVNSLTNNYVFAIEEDKARQCLWIGTEGGGLNRFNLNDGTYKVYTSQTGLPSDIVYGIVLDHENDIWLGTAMGVVRYDPDKNIFRIYQQSDGLPSAENNFGAYTITSDGMVFFGTNSGAVGFYPSEIIDFQERPNIYITSFEVNGKDFLVPEGMVNVNFLSSLTLKHNENLLAFQLEAIELTNFGKNTYQWFLEGFDEEWSKPSMHSNVTYSNLGPGKYVFHYLASNCDGIWMRNPKTLEIIILPPFWRTPPAYFLYFILCTLLALTFMLIVYLRNREKLSVERNKLFVNLAHDIRTPLSIIKLSSDRLISQKDNLPLDVQQNLRFINKNTQRLNRFVTQLLDFHRQGSASITLKLQSTNLQEFVAEIAGSFSPVIEEKQLNFQCNIDTLICVMIDRKKFEKVVNNFLSNAIKYTPEGRSIRIEGSEQNGKYFLKFIDEGIGIPESGRRQLFSRYYRAENVENIKEVGSGVGLMLSKAIIEEHKGSVECISRQGDGTTFTIWLPKTLPATMHAGVDPSKDDSKPVIGKETEVAWDDPEDRHALIMIVEDNDELRRLLYDTLGSIYRVIAYSDGKEAYRQLMDDLPDMIISDVMMQEMSGYELCFRVKNDIKTSHIPVILITALSAPINKLEGIETGADAYLEKPIDLDLLMATIRNLMRSRKLSLLNMQKELSDSTTASFSISDNEFVGKAISLVKKHMANEEFAVDDLCRYIGVSRSVLFRRIKSVLDISPSELILKTRLNHAVKLMVTTNYSISEIATECGFSNPKYFSTVFKKVYNSSPKEYQQVMKKRETRQ